MPPNNKSPIAQYSPNFAAQIHRAGLEGDQGLLEAGFAFAVQFAGLREWDFVREEGVSFNPRPARVGILMLSDVRERDLKVITAAVLATATLGCEELDLFLESRPEAREVSQLAKRSLLSPPALREAPFEARRIACALHLDRARHRHLSIGNSISDDFLKLTAEFEELAKESAPGVQVLFQAWINRAVAQGQRLRARGGP